jgi:hypothetical protein
VLTVCVPVCVSVSVCVYRRQHDVESLSEFLVVCEFVLAVGSVNYSESKGAEARCAARMALLNEPAAAGALLASNGTHTPTTTQDLGTTVR